MQVNQDKNTSTGEAQTEYDRILKKVPVRTWSSAPVQTGPGAHTASYTKGTGFLSRG